MIFTPKISPSPGYRKSTLSQGAFEIYNSLINREPLKLFLGSFGGIAANEADALRDLRQGVIPVVFVFDGHVAFEALAFEFVQNSGDITDACAPGYVMTVAAELMQVFHVGVDDTAFEDFQAVDRVQTAADPVPDIGDEGRNGLPAVMMLFP